MKTLLPVSLLLLLAGCRTYDEPYSPVRNVHYAAHGQNPFWTVAIGDDRIVIRTAGPDPLSSQEPAVFPRTLPRTVDGVRTWESGSGTAVISIEARPGPCEGWAGRLYQDHVRVRLSGRELTGCGGRPLEERR